MEAVSMVFEEGMEKLKGFPVAVFWTFHLWAPLNMSALSSGSLPDPQLLPG